MVLIAASIPTLRPLMSIRQSSDLRYKYGSPKTPFSDCVSPKNGQTPEGRLKNSGWHPIDDRRHQSWESQKKHHITVDTDTEHNVELEVGCGRGISTGV